MSSDAWRLPRRSSVFGSSRPLTLLPVSKKATPAPLNQVTLPPSMPYDSVAPHLKESASYLSQDEEAFSAILLKAAAYLPLLVNTILIQTPIMLVRWLVSTESSTESQHKDTSTMTKDLESGLYLEKCSSRSTCTTLLSVQEPGGDSRPVSGFDWLK